MITLPALAVIGSILAASPPASPVATPEAILVRLQARYVEAAALSLDFVQRYHSRRTGSVIEESGVLYTQRPGRMRWEYRLPEEKLFIMADGLGWFYVPEDEVVYRMNTMVDGARRLPSLFLAGVGDLNRDFAARMDPDAPAIRIELRPRTLGENYDYLLLDIEPSSFALRVLTVVDALGNRTEYAFREERANPVLPDRAFRFEVPLGVEVVEADPQ